ncbi:unnamed protein product [Symbiodinium sp. KB8]|nr:unnamed protein product [Symbiodinium sp. KB8]
MPSPARACSAETRTWHNAKQSRAKRCNGRRQPRRLVEPVLLSFLWRDRVEASRFLQTSLDSKVDIKSYSSVFIGITAAARWADGQHLLEELRWRARPEDIVVVNSMGSNALETSVVGHNAAASACEKGYEWARALGVLSALRSSKEEPGVVSYAAVASACEKRRRWEVAFQLALDLEAAGGAQNVVLRGSLVSACEKDRRWEAGMLLLQAFRPWRVSQQEIGFASATSACEKAKRWRQAMGLVRFMHQCGLQPYIFSANAGLSALEKAACWARGLALFEDFACWSLEATETTFSALMSACEKARRLETALGLLALSRPRGRLPRPSVIHYNSALSLCFGTGEWELALALLARLEDSTLAPTTVSLEPVAAVLESHEQAGFLPRLELKQRLTLTWAFANFCILCEVEKAPGNPHYRGTELCSFFLKGMCRHGTKCNFAHSINDLKEKPDFSKTRLCTNYFKTKSPFGKKSGLETWVSVWHALQLRPQYPGSTTFCKDEMRSAARSRAAREKVTIDLPEEPGINTPETREELTLGSRKTPVLQDPVAPLWERLLRDRDSTDLLDSARLDDTTGCLFLLFCVL